MRTGIGVIAALACWLMAGSALSAAGAKRPAHLYTTAVDVDVQGHVVHTQPAADTPAPIAAVLDQSLKQWRFAPVMQDGHAASVHSYLVADVQALPAGAGKFSVRVSYVGAGPRYEEPTTRKGPDFPPQVLQALVEGNRSHSDTVVAINLALAPGGKLTATDAHVTTHAELNMREKLTLIAAVKRYLLQGSVRPELVDGQVVTATVQKSVDISLGPVGPPIEIPVSGPHWSPEANSDPSPAQVLAAQAATSAAAYQDASQSHSVLQPSMVDTVTFQP